MDLHEFPDEAKAFFGREDWLSCFTTGDIHEAQLIYIEGGVQDIHVDAAKPNYVSFRASVLTSRDAVGIHVYVYLDQMWDTVRCTCPLHGRRPCSHAAAAFYEIKEYLSGDLGTRIPQPRLSRNLHRWLRELSHEPDHPIDRDDPNIAPSYPNQVAYVLRPVHAGRSPLACGVRVMQARGKKTGGYSQVREAYIDTKAWVPAKYFAVNDVELVRKMVFASSPVRPAEWALRGGPEWIEILRGMLATKRCFWSTIHSAPLVEGPPRKAMPSWKTDAEGMQIPSFDMEGHVDAFCLTAPVWYVDGQAGLCGPVECSLKPEVAAHWITGPKVAPEEVFPLLASLEKSPVLETLPRPHPATVEHVEGHKPRPVLTLLKCDVKLKSEYSYLQPAIQSLILNIARLTFEYDGHPVPGLAKDAVYCLKEDQKIFYIHRLLAEESEYRSQLRNWNLTHPHDSYLGLDSQHISDYIIEGELFAPRSEAWLNFVVRGVAKLRADGWQIDVDPSFDYSVIEPEAWYSELEEEGGSGSGWFEFEMGVEHEGARVNMLPVITTYLRENPSLTLEGLAALPRGDAVPLPLPDGKACVAISAERLHGILAALIEIWDSKKESKSRLRLHKLRVAELAAVAGEDAAVEITHRQLGQLGKKLAEFKGLKPVSVPRGFKGELRPYQSEGLDWLQFLRELQLGGILADDMGLGKTIQTLVHLQKEKQAGRAKLPSLIVAPTSVLANWSHEARHFTPGMKTVILRGPDRQAHFPEIPKMDLVFTSYALLVRDGDELLKHNYHYVILDEAQYIKNPKAKAAITARQLQTNHRLCLTGTPMENHLGELWSLFHFLVPGYLGDSKSFRTLYRNPIERHNDDGRRQHLFRRVAPMLMRRTKDAVLSELPPKTEIIQRVSLTPAQADLYEAVRATMDKKIREEIQARGVNRSHIIILDAMLKLRQVCCHPQLLKLAAAKKVKDSAKLTQLMEMLGEMLEEGRRILLFSQFTTMLGLIEEELRRQDFDYVKLTGNTLDRISPVRAFQEGRVSLFLISLKAGGTGLNLTAADTVIHYDPWWNPAVENQATDRAHRIGQDKSVFVYKLIMENTIEEKIVELQSRKRDLVEGLLKPGTNRTSISEEDLRYLFASNGAPS